MSELIPISGPDGTIINVPVEEVNERVWEAETIVPDPPKERKEYLNIGPILDHMLQMRKNNEDILPLLEKFGALPRKDAFVPMTPQQHKEIMDIITLAKMNKAAVVIVNCITVRDTIYPDKKIAENLRELLHLCEFKWDRVAEILVSQLDY